MDTYSEAIKKCMNIPYTRDNGIQLLKKMENCLTDYRCSYFEERATEFIKESKSYELQLLVKECRSLIFGVGGWRSEVIAWGEGSKRAAEDFWNAYINLYAVCSFVDKCVVKMTKGKNND